MKKILIVVVFVYMYSCGKIEGSGEGTDGIATNDHRLFVSSTSFTGNIGGLSGADAECAKLATAAGLKRTYMAVLSDLSTDAINRLTISGALYTVGTNSTTALVAASSTDFWGTEDKNLLNRVNVDETGLTVSSTPWTGTDSEGSDMDGTFGTCSSWTTNSIGTGGTGSTDNFNTQWTENISAICSSSFPIYCISQ